MSTSKYPIQLQYRLIINSTFTLLGHETITMKCSELLKLLLTVAGILSSLKPAGFNETDPDHPSFIVQEIKTKQEVIIASFLVVQRASGRPLTYVKPKPCNTLLSMAWNILLIQAGDVEVHPGPNENSDEASPDRKKPRRELFAS